MNDDTTEIIPDTGSESKDDKMSPAELAKHWLIEIDLAEKAHKAFWSEGKEAQDKYLSVKGGKDCGKQANIYFASIESVKPSIYSQVPNPDIRRRNKDNDVIARVSAEILERATKYSMDCHQDINHVLECARDDYLLPGRCVTWERFLPTLETSEEQIPLSMEEAEAGYSDALDRKVKPDEIQQNDGGLYVIETQEKIVHAESVTEYVNWRDYLHNPARTMDEIRWRGRRHYLTRDELKKEYPDKDIDEIERTVKPPTWDKETGSIEDQKRYTRAEVWEIWDKPTRQVLHICKGYKTGPLKVQDDPLGLKNFFPCPTEAVAISCTSNVIPRTEYRAAREQSETIDKLTERIDILLDSIRVSGVYDKAAGPEVGAILKKDGVLIPIMNWPQFQNAGGWQGVMQLMPLDGIVAATQQLYDARDRELQMYYEITGYSDIMRGVSDPKTTAKAETIKSMYASSRVREKQRRFQRFIKDVIAIKAEVIAEQFPPDVLIAMSGVSGYSEKLEEAQLYECADMLRDDVRRNYLLEIETDSTVAANDIEEKAARNEFLNAVSPFMQQTIAAIQQTPALGTAFTEILLFVVRGYKAGRGLEAVIENASKQLQEAQQQAANQPLLPEQQKIEAQIQLEHIRSQAKLHSEQMKLQGQMQIEQFKAERQTMLEQQKAYFEQQQAEIAGKLELMIQIVQAENRMTLEKMQAQADIAVKMAEQATKQNQEVAKPKEGESKQQPIINVHIPGEKPKRIKLGNDPVTGERFAISEPL